MRIAVDATSIGGGQGGDETMVRGMLSGLAAATPVATAVELIVRAEATRQLPEAAVRDPRAHLHPISRAPGVLHFSAGLPLALARLRPAPDAVLAVIHAPLLHRVPTALMVPDLSFLHHPEHYPPVHRQRLRRVVAHQVRQVETVLTLSDFCRNDLISSYDLPPDKVHVVPGVIEDPPEPGAADIAEVDRFLAEHGIRGRFVLYLGNLHPRKNVLRSMQAFLDARASGHLTDVQLVVAGATWWGDADEQALAAGHPHDIVVTGRVSHGVRDGLLRAAEVLVYASLFEGFGLPPLEAMIRGTPAIVSDRASLPEVTAGNAATVDPYDVAAIRDALVSLVDGDGPSPDQLAAARAQARSFTAARTGEALDRALSTLGARRPHAHRRRS